jgi:hypothetical protein
MISQEKWSPRNKKCHHLKQLALATNTPQSGSHSFPIHQTEEWSTEMIEYQPNGKEDLWKEEMRR